MKKVFLAISQNSQGNTCASLFFKTETLAQVFPCETAKFLRTPFFIEHLWWLLLNTIQIGWTGIRYLYLAEESINYLEFVKKRNIL